MADAIKAAYDESTDVLYLTVGEPDRRARSRSDENGLIWRTSPDGECRGVTVMNVKTWHSRASELAKIVAAGLHLSTKKVEQRIAEVA